jgi:hypothetical protein
MNYHYLPTGLQSATTQKSTIPPRFQSLSSFLAGSTISDLVVIFLENLLYFLVLLLARMLNNHSAFNDGPPLIDSLVWFNYYVQNRRELPVQR